MSHQNACTLATITRVEAATRKASSLSAGSPGTGSDDRKLALQLGSLMFLLMSSDRGATLSAIDESGLGLIPAKALFTVSSAPEDSKEWSVKGVADHLGVSVPSASRAIDCLVKRKLATRTEDPADRRVRRVALTTAGRELSDSILSTRLHGLEDFASSLDAKERRALQQAFELLLKRPEVERIYRNNRRRAGR